MIKRSIILGHIKAAKEALRGQKYLAGYSLKTAKEKKTSMQKHS